MKRDGQRYNITAIIYDKKGRVLSIGQNSYLKSHPMQAKHALLCGEEYKIYMHAEVSAITRCKDLSKAHRIQIIRYDRSGNPACSAPCPICVSAIAATPIRQIDHT